MASEQDLARAEAFGDKLEAFSETLSPQEQTWLLSICAAACSTLDPDAVEGYSINAIDPGAENSTTLSAGRWGTIFATTALS